MGFLETIKIRVKKKAFFRCVVCYQVVVEVHHIKPQADGGPDTEENAAPLCGHCHRIYGGNPDLRPFIRQARDHWYEFCSKFTNPDTVGAQIDQKRKENEKQTTYQLIGKHTPLDPNKRYSPDIEPIVGKSLPRHIADRLTPIAPATEDYNCFSYVLGDLSQWIEPHSLEAFIAVLEEQGYTKSPGGVFRPGFEKIVIHADERHAVTQAALQSSEGKWSTKLGSLGVYSYDDPDLLAPLFGSVVAFFERPVPSVSGELPA